MVAGTIRPPTVLSPHDLEFFREHGFIQLKEAFPRQLALALQDEIWDELGEEHKIQRDDRDSWMRLPHSPRRAKHSALNLQLFEGRFTAAMSDLLGYDDWKRPATWGGFNVFFPDEPGTEWQLPTKTWHWDGPPTGAGLLIFSFYGEVQKGGGGTLIVDGSHRLVQNYYDSLSPDDRVRPHKFHRKDLSRWDPWLQALTGQSKKPVTDRVDAFMQKTTLVRGVPCRVLELTGDPGDAFYCNLGMLHCIAPNTSDHPRFLRVKFLLLDH